MQQSINICGSAFDAPVFLHPADKSIPPLPNLSEVDRWDLGELADEIATDDVDSCYRYDLGDGISLYLDLLQGSVSYAAITDDDMYEHLQEWYHNAGPDCELAEWYSSWGWDGMHALEEPDTGYDGPCRVWRKPNYYPSTYGAPKAGFARDDQDNIIEFGSLAEAQAYVAEYYSEPSAYDDIPQCNVLSHGQAGSDDLTIVEAA